MNNSYSSISVIGAGAWGTAIASTLSKNQKFINLWAKELEVTNSINTKNENTLFLPGIKLSPKIKAHNDFKFLEISDLLFFVTPAQYFRQTLENITQLSYYKCQTLNLENTGMKRFLTKRKAPLSIKKVGL